MNERGLVGRIGFFLAIAVPAVVALGFVLLVILTLFGTPVDIFDSLAPDPRDVGCEGDQPGPAALVVFDTASGELAWTRRVGSSRGMGVVDGVIVVGNARGTVRGIDGATGDDVWCTEEFEVERDPNSAMPGQIAVAGDVVATMSDRTLVGLDPATGRTAWQTELGSPEQNEPSPVSTIAYVSEARLLGGSNFWLTTGGADGLGSTPVDPANGSLLDPAQVEDPQADHGNQMVVDDFQLSIETPWRDGRQEIDLAVTDLAERNQRWAATVPGYIAMLREQADGAGIVLVIDQTGGTGQVFGETLLTAYGITDGSLLWQRPVPLSASALFQTSPGVVILTGGTDLIGVDLDTGETLWSVDHGSPGRERPWRVDGGYMQLEAIGDGAIAVGRVVAQRPYRD